MTIDNYVSLMKEVFDKNGVKSILDNRRFIFLLIDYNCNRYELNLEWLRILYKQGLIDYLYRTAKEENSAGLNRIIKQCHDSIIKETRNLPVDDLLKLLKCMADVMCSKCCPLRVRVLTDDGKAETRKGYTWFDGDIISTLDICPFLDEDRLFSVHFDCSKSCFYLENSSRYTWSYNKANLVKKYCQPGARVQIDGECRICILERVLHININAI